MISESELLAVKARLMLASDAAHLIISSPGPAPVRFTEEQYWRVHESLSRMREDLGVVLGELDTLRNLFVDSVHDFFEAKVTDEIQVGGITVAAVPDGADRDGSAEARDDAPVPSEPAPTGRANRRKRSRTKPRGNTESVRIVEEGVDSGDAPKPVGGQSPGE